MDANNLVETAAGVGSYKDLQGKRVLVSGVPAAFIVIDQQTCRLLMSCLI